MIFFFLITALTVLAKSVSQRLLLTQASQEAYLKITMNIMNLPCRTPITLFTVCSNSFFPQTLKLKGCIYKCRRGFILTCQVFIQNQSVFNSPIATAPCNSTRLSNVMLVSKSAFAEILTSTLPTREAKSPSHIYILEDSWKEQDLLDFHSSIATIILIAVLNAITCI